MRGPNARTTYLYMQSVVCVFLSHEVLQSHNLIDDDDERELLLCVWYSLCMCDDLLQKNHHWRFWDLYEL